MKEKKSIQVNEISTQLKTTKNPFKGNQNNKIGETTIQYFCFIYGGLDHKIFDCPHCQAVLEIFKNKKVNSKQKK